MSVVTLDLDGSPEDDRYRSRFIQHLLHQHVLPAYVQCDLEPIPRVIVQYWHDRHLLPEDVLVCMNSWEALSALGFERRMFDDLEARCFIEENYEDDHVRAFDRCYHPAMRCDYFRLCYILRCGGFYVDADELYIGTDVQNLFGDSRLKIQPLCYDIPSGLMVAPDEFWSDVSSHGDRIFYVNNNPLIGPAGHPLLNIALERATHRLLSSCRHPDIQSTTGPGNLSASLVGHAKAMLDAHAEWDFVLLRDWEHISTTIWNLSYRNDVRNWRILHSASTDSTQARGS